MTDMVYIDGTLSGGNVVDYRIAFEMPDSSKLEYEQSVSLDGNEMQSDELYVTLRCRESVLTVSASALPTFPGVVVTGYVQFRTVNDETFITSDGKTFCTPKTMDLAEAWLSMFRGVRGDTPIWYERTDENGNCRLEKYYWKTLQRVAMYDYELTAQSPIGRLTADFPGDLYDGDSLSDVLAAVMGETVPFSVDSRLDTVRVYGWLPYQSRRECIHMLALACGFIIRRDSSHDLFFTLPDSASVALPDTVIFNGGSVDYRIGAAYAQIDVTEYAFLKTDNDKEVTLFDNRDGSPAAVEQTIRFSDAPVYDVTASEGLTVHSSGVNSAVISGIGVLTGKAYTVIQSILSVAGDLGADPEQVLSVDNIPLITNLNSETVAQKYLSSVNASTVVNMDFIRHAENAGDRLSFVDPYGTARTGYLLSMSGNVSSIDRVSGKFLAGYVHHWGNTYNAVSLLDDSGTWTVPDALDGATVRVVLIGGGQGGASGKHGSDNNGSGGGKGLPGSGGNVYVVKFTVSAGQTFAYTSGVGGNGGTPSDTTSEFPSDSMTVYTAPSGERWHMSANCGNGHYSPTTYALAVQRGLTPCENCAKDGDLYYYLSNDGANGSPSTFGDYSSDDGASISVGYRDMIDGVQYALPGPDNGIDGGAATTATENGDKTAPLYTDDVIYHAVTLPWNIYQSWSSGFVGGGQSYHQERDGDYPAFNEWAYGGIGGGAAVGAEGAPGTNAIASDTGGNGGNGADASAIFPENDIRTYGSGGSGGHGGGEGGKGGSGHTTAIVLPSGDTADAFNGSNGSGGSGSAGQPGKNGCILIYYKSHSEGA